MDIKTIYEALSAIDGGAEMVTFLKDDVVKVRDEAESQNRTMKAQLEQIKDLDIADLKSKAEFIDGSGGVEELQKVIAKAQGYEGNEEKLKQAKADFEALQAKHQGEVEKSAQEVALLNTKLDLIPKISGVMNADSIEDVVQMAISTGYVSKGENGLSVKDGDSVLSWAEGGSEKFKERFSYALNKPSGGNAGGGASQGGTGGGQAPMSLSEKIAAKHKN